MEKGFEHYLVGHGQLLPVGLVRDTKAQIQSIRLLGAPGDDQLIEFAVADAQRLIRLEKDGDSGD